jgi:hypothetical protein
MNFTTNKRNSQKMGPSKHTLAKTHLKNSSLQKTSIQNENLNQA